MAVENPGPAAQGQPLVQIGDISADQQWVQTPSGSAPVAQVTWTAVDMIRWDRAIPTYAVVLAIIFSLACLLGLLFLLIKEDRVTGWIQVTVQGPGLTHTTHVPVYSQAVVADTHARVTYARSLTAAAQR